MHIQSEIGVDTNLFGGGEIIDLSHFIVNHGYDAEIYLKTLSGERIAYAHIADHYYKTKDLIIDSHGTDVIDRVWELLDNAYGEFGVFPRLLERDLNIPLLDDLLRQVDRIGEIQQRHLGDQDHQALGHR